MGYLISLLDAGTLTPHGFCLSWEPGLIWLQAGSDVAIALAYYSIPAALVFFLRRRRDLAFPWMFGLFAAFILACGTTHIFGAVTLWLPAYWAEGLTKAVTALLSIATAAALWRLMPQAIALPSMNELHRNNQALQHEIDERKRAEAALRRSEERFRSAMLHSAIGMALVSLDDVWLQVNDALCRITGYDGDELSRLRFQDITHPDDLSRDLAELGALLRGEIESYRIEKRYIRRDGAPTWVQLTVSLARDAGGAPLHFISQVQDIQEQREAASALERSEQRLRQAEKMSALGQLAGGVAHDFNNVLQAVQGAAGLIRRSAGNAQPIERLVGMVEDATRRGGAVTRRLLAFSRRGDLRVEPIELSGLLEEVRVMLAHTVGDAIAVELGCEPALPNALADPDHLETVLVNLATNARDAMPAGGTLRIAAELEAAAAGEPEGRSFLRISVVDTGIGMGPETLARATEPFFTTKPHGKGTGLGLALAREFCEQSGGRLRIESAPGAGTAVSLLLPIARHHEPASRAPVTAEARSGATLRVLVVDDDPIVRETTCAGLAGLGYAVVPAVSGEAALAQVAAGAGVDVVVTDLSMPVMDGLALIDAIRERHPGMPALLVTGFLEEATVLAARTGHHLTVLRKPVTARELADRIEQTATATSPAM